jgi:hypothetical protein
VLNYEFQISSTHLSFSAQQAGEKKCRAVPTWFNVRLNTLRRPMRVQDTVTKLISNHVIFLLYTSCVRGAW